MPGYEAARFNPPPGRPGGAAQPPQWGYGLRRAVASGHGCRRHLVARATVERLGVPTFPGQHYELMGFDGSRSFAPVVIADMIFLKRVFRGRYLLMEGEGGILDRDILNHATLLLDGPRHQWSEHVG